MRGGHHAQTMGEVIKYVCVIDVRCKYDINLKIYVEDID